MAVIAIVLICIGAVSATDEIQDGNLTVDNSQDEKIVIDEINNADDTSLEESNVGVKNENDLLKVSDDELLKAGASISDGNGATGTISGYKVGDEATINVQAQAYETHYLTVDGSNVDQHEVGFLQSTAFTFTYKFTQAKDYTIQVTSGAGNSNILIFKVTGGSSSTTETAVSLTVPSSGTVNTAVNIPYSVTEKGSTTGVSSGTLTFYDGTTQIGNPITLTSSSGTFTYTFTRAKTYNIKAVYTAATGYADSESSVSQIVVSDSGSSGSESDEITLSFEQGSSSEGTKCLYPFTEDTAWVSVLGGNNPTYVNFVVDFGSNTQSSSVIQYKTSGSSTWSDISFTGTTPRISFSNGRYSDVTWAGGETYDIRVSNNGKTSNTLTVKCFQGSSVIYTFENSDGGNEGETITFKFKPTFSETSVYPFIQGYVSFFSSESRDAASRLGTIYATSSSELDNGYITGQITLPLVDSTGEYEIYYVFVGQATQYGSATGYNDIDSFKITINDVAQVDKDTTASLSPSSYSITKGETQTITPTIVDSDSNPVTEGTITYYDGENPISGYTEVSTTTVFNTADLDEGTHYIKVKYNGADGYNPSELSDAVTVTVTLPNTDTIKVSVTNTTYGSTVATVTVGQAGTYTLKINDVTYNAEITFTGAGSQDIPITGYAASQSTYTATVSDKNNVELINSTTFTISQATPSLSVTVNGNNTLLTDVQTVTVTADGRGKVKINNGAEEELGTITLTGLTAGMNTINVLYTGDENYTSKSETVYVNVYDKYPSSVSIELNNSKVVKGDSIKITPTVAVNDNGVSDGTVVFYNENDEEIGRINLNEKQSLDYQVTGDEGSAHSIYAVYLENTNLQSAQSRSESKSYNVKKVLVITLTKTTQDPITYSSFSGSIDFTIDYSDEVSDNLTLYNGDSVVFGEDGSSSTSVSYRYYGKGHNDFYIKFTGTDDFAPCESNHVDVIVYESKSVSTSLDVNASYVVEGDKILFTPGATYYNSGYVNAPGNVSITDASGNVIYEGPASQTVEYSVAETSGDESSYRSTFNINYIKYVYANETTGEYYVFSQNYGSSKSVTIMRKNAATLTANGEGSALEVNTSQSITLHVEVDKWAASSTFDYSSSSYSYSSNVDIYIKTPGSEGFTKLGTFEASSSSIQDAKLSFTELGEYVIYVYYNGLNASSQYDPSYAPAKSNEVTITVVNPTTLELSKNKDSVYYTGQEVIINPTVTNRTGDVITTGTVTYMEGENVLATLNAGTAYVNNAFSAGTHTIKAIYNSNDEYTESNVAEITFEVKLVSGFTVSVDDVVYGTDPVATVSVSQQGIYVLKIDGVQYGDELVFESEGSKQVTLTGFKAHDGYNATIWLDDISNYTLFNISRAAPTLEITVNGNNTLSDETHSISVSTQGTGTVSTDFSTGDYAIDSEIPLSNLANGLNTVTVTYSGDENYTDKEEQIIINVFSELPTDIELDINETSISSGQAIKVNVTAVNQYGEINKGTVEFYWKNNDTLIGTIELPTKEFVFNPTLTAGTYEIYARYVQNTEDKYAQANSTTKSFKIKSDITITLTREDSGLVKPGDRVYFIITNDAGVELDLMDNNTGILWTENGDARTWIDFEESDIGTHEIFLRFNGTEDYNAVDSNHVTVKVVKPTETIVIVELNSTEAIPGSKLNVTAKVLEKESGEVVSVGTISIKDYIYGSALGTIDVGGYYVYTTNVNEYPSGNPSSIYATYNGGSTDDKIYAVSEQNRTTYYLVYSNSLTLKANDNAEITVGTGSTVNFLADLQRGTGNLVLIDSNGNEVEISSGANHPIVFQTAGDYTYYAKFTRTEGIYASVESEKVTVHVVAPKDAELTLANTTATVIVYGNAVSIQATVLSDGEAVTAGNISYYVDGKYVGNYSIGTPFTTSADLSVASHVISARYLGTDLYNPTDSANNITITVNPKATEITISTENTTVYAGETITFTHSVKSGEDSVSAGNVTYKIVDGDDLAVEVDVSSPAEFSIETPGEYDIVATYNGNDIYGVNTTTTSTHVIVKGKLDIALTFEDGSTEYNTTIASNEWIKFNADTDGENPELIILVDGVEKGTIASGKTSQSIRFVSSDNGNHTVQLKYAATTLYDEALSNVISLNIFKRVSVTPSITVTPINVMNGSKVVVTVGASNNAPGYVEIYSDYDLTDLIETIAIDGGKYEYLAKIDSFTESSKSASLYAKYVNNKSDYVDYQHSSRGSATFNVIRENSMNLTADNYDVKVGDEVTLTVEIQDWKTNEYKSNVIINVDGEDKYEFEVSGYYSPYELKKTFVISFSDVKEHTVYAYYKGCNASAGYLSTAPAKSSPIIINVKPAIVETELTFDNDTQTVKYNNTVSFNPTVMADGEKLTKGNITYSENGVNITTLGVDEAFTYTPADMNTHVITAKFNGIDEFNESTATITINVVKADNNATIIIAENNYLPRNVTVQVKGGVKGKYVVSFGEGRSVEVEVSEDNGLGQASYALPADSYEATLSLDSEYYQTTADPVSFKVIKSQNTVTISIDKNNYLPGAVSVNVTANVADNYTITIGDNQVVVDVKELADGIYKGSNTIILPAGEDYVAETTFADTENYTVTINSATFNVVKSNVTLSIVVPTVLNGNNATVKITTDVAGTYTISIDGFAPFTKDLVAGENTITTEYKPALSTESYNANVSIAETPDYNAKSANTTFKVVQDDVEFSVVLDKDSYTYGDAVKLIVTISEGATGKVSFTYNNGTPAGEIEDISKSKELILGILNADSYNLTATYEGNTQFAGKTVENIQFTVQKATNEITVSVTPNKYPGEVTIKVTATVNDVYEIDINGTKLNVASGDEGLTHKFAAGNYYANITYKNSNYDVITHNIRSFIVEKGDNTITISVDKQSYIYGDEITVTVSADVNDTYTISLDETHSVDVAATTENRGKFTGSIVLPWTLNVADNYELTTIWSNANYTEATVNAASFNITKKANKVSVSVDDFAYGDVTTVTITDALVDGIYRVQIDETHYVDVEVTTKDNDKFNGTIATSFDLPVKTDLYTASVSLVNDNYETTGSDTFKVTPKANEITVSINSINYGDNLTVNISNAVKGTYVVTVEGNEIIVEVNDDGVGSNTMFIDLAAKEGYSASVEFDNSNYETTYNHIAFNVDKLSNVVTISIDKDNYLPGAVSVNVTANVADSYTVTIGDNNVVVDVKELVDGIYKGSNTITLPAGEDYVAETTFADTENYTVTINSASFNVKKSNIELDVIAMGNNSVVNVGDKSITVNVDKSDATGKIQYFNGTTQLGEGNLLDLTDYPAGTHTITIKYADDENYEADDKVVKFIINLPEVETHVYLELNSTEVRVNGKILITAHVVDDNGNEIKVGKVRLFTSSKGTNDAQVAEIDAASSWTLTVDSNTFFTYYNPWKVFALYDGITSDGIVYKSSENRSGNTYYHVSANSLTLTVNGQNEITVVEGTSVDFVAKVENGKGPIVLVDENGVESEVTSKIFETVGNFTYYAKYTMVTDDYYASVVSDVVTIHVIPIRSTELTFDNDNPTAKFNNSVSINPTVMAGLEQVTKGTITYFENGAEIVTLDVDKAFTYTPADMNTHVITAKYNGIDDLNESTATITINVVKADNNIKVEVETADYPNNVTVKVTADIAGTYDVVLSDGQIVSVLVSTNEGTGFKSIKLDAGSYDANITYVNENYEGIVTNNSFVVGQATNNIEVIVVNRVLPGDVTVTVKADVSGIYEVIIGAYSVNVTVDETGEGSNAISLPAGLDYVATTTFADIKNYKVTVKDVKFNVTKGINNIKVEVETADYPNNVTVKVTADIAGTYTVDINGTKVNVKVESDKGTGFTTQQFNPGYYSANIVDYSSDIYESIIVNDEFKVKTGVSIDDNVLSVVNGTEPTFSIALPDDATGNLTVVVNGKEYSAELVDGKATVTVDDLAPSDYVATVLYSGDDNYAGAELTTGFTVEKQPVVIDDSVLSVVNGTEPTFSIVLPDDATGNLTVVVNGKEYSAELVDGKATVTVDDLAPNNYTATVKYSGDDNYAGAELTTGFTVEKQPVVIDDSVLSVVNGTEPTFSIALPEGATGNLTVVVNGKEYSAELVDGKATVTVDDLAPSDYVATVLYSGDDNYTGAELTTDFTVEKQPVTMDDTVLSVTNSTKPTVTIKLPENATGTLSVKVGDKIYNSTLENGSATVVIDDLAVGEYNATVSYSGDDNYSDSEINTKFSVTKAQYSADQAFNISLADDSTIPTFTINLPSDATGNFTVNVDGKNYTKELVNGSATISIDDLLPGKHNVVVSYTGDGKYSAITQNTTVTIPNPILTNNKNIKVVYSAKATYQVRVTVNGKVVVGETVSIKYNGKTYNVKTDKNGYASLKLKTNIKVKKYTITATFKGVKVTNQVTIKHVIKAKNLKIKKSKKVVKIKVKTYKVNKKYLKGKKLKLKIKGKTLKAKINKKGVATFKLKKNVLKKLKVGKKYKYRVTYGKDKVTKKIKVRR